MTARPESLRAESDPSITVVWNHVSQPLTSSGAAVNIVIRELSRVAALAGVRSTVVATDRHDLSLPNAQLRPVDFSRVSDRAQLLLGQRLADTVNGHLGRNRTHVARLYQPIAEALRGSDGPIIVHDGYLGAAGLVTLRQMFPDRMIILWMHQPLSPAYSTREVRRFLSLADRVICVSDWLRGSLSRAARSKEVDARLITVLNGVDSERFHPAGQTGRDDVPSILFSGRVVRVKGPDVLARALSELHDEGLDFHATFLGVAHPDIHGTSRYERSVRQTTASFSDKVSFVPFRAHSELPDVYRAHDIMVVPSRFQEPFSLALLEGMASGLAIVASRRGGMPQVGDVSVQYFERQPELTAVLRTLLRDAELRRHWGRLARSRAEDLSWSRTFAGADDLISIAAAA